MDAFIKNWHKRLLSQAEDNLGRALSQSEQVFITSRQSGLALELVESSIEALRGQDLEAYLGSDHK